MLDARRQSFLVAGLAGLGAGSLGWLVLGSAAVGNRIDALEAAFSTESAVPRIDQSVTNKALLSIRVSPLFHRPGTSTAPPVRLEGVALRPGANSALLAIGGSAAKWLMQGETSEGVTLMQVRSGAAAVETSDGVANLVLGQTWTPGTAASADPP